MSNEFLFPKIEEKYIGNIWLQEDGVCATQPKLHPMFYAVFLKIALSVVELMFFGHLKATIWHRCTIIYADKPETIDALKDNIREAIDEI